MWRKNRKIIGILLGTALTIGVLCGCDDEYTEVYESEVQNENGVEEDSLVRGSDLELGMEVAEQEEDPARQVRRSTTRVGQVFEVKLDGTEVPEDFYMYRSTLSSQCQRAYDQICTGFAQGSDSILLSVPIDKDQLRDVFFLLCMIIRNCSG